MPLTKIASIQNTKILIKIIFHQNAVLHSKDLKIHLKSTSISSGHFSS